MTKQADRIATLAIAREDWAHCYANCNPSMTLCADDLIALAVDCKKQSHSSQAGLTPDDAKIIYRRAPLCVIDANGNYRSFSNDLPTLHYLMSLNS